MTGFTPTQMRRRVVNGGASAVVDLTTSPPPPPKKHALEYDPDSSLPKPKKLCEAQADTTEAKMKGKQPLVQAIPQRRYHDFATPDSAGPAIIAYDGTDRRSFVANRHFFARISKEDLGLRLKNTAPYEYYNVELSANGLEHLNTDNREEDQQIQIGSAFISVAETRCEDVYRCCNIVRLEVETGNTLINMEAFAEILRCIRSFCVEQKVEHLAMAPVPRSCWFSGLLGPAGFNQCECERLDKHVGVNLQLCMVLPPPKIESPAVIGADESSFDTRFVPHHLKTNESGVASPAVAPPAENAQEGLRADSLQPRFQGPSLNIPRRKTYCMLWIRRGECDFMQTGCRFLHEMPVDKETREKIGVRQIPQWFKNSPEYRNFQQQVQRSTSERLSVHSETDTSSTSLPSAQSSDEKGGEGSWRRGGRPAETPRDPVRIGSFIVHFPREDWHQDTNASGTKGKTSPLDAPPPTGSQASRNIYRPPGSRMPSSGTVVSTIKGRTSHVWRARRDNHRPAGSNLSYHGNGSRAANKERSRTKDEEPSEGEGRRGHEVMTIKSESGSQ